MEIYAIDTEEKLNWFLNALENEEIVIDGRHLTEQDKEEIDKEIARQKAMRKEKAKELVLA